MCPLVALALLTGCKSDEPDTPTTETAELTLEQTTVDITADGGHFEVNYTLTNATEGAEIKVNCEREWVRNIAVKDGVIAFDVDASYE